MYTDIPSGAIDGANTVFTLTHTPITGTLQLFWNGAIQQENTDFTLSGSTVTFTNPPHVGDWLIAYYMTTSATTGVGASWPVVQIGDVANWVANTKLVRPDLMQVAIEEATDFYRTLCARVPFDQLMVTSEEKPVTASVGVYSLGDFDPAVAGIVSLRMTYGANQYMRLRRSNARNFDQMCAITNSRPYWYIRHGGNIEFLPVPNLSTYTYRLRYWTYPVILNDPQNTICVYDPEWKELHKWETLYRVYMILDEHDKAMALVQPAVMPRQASPKKTTSFEIGIIPRLWNDLLRTVTQREAIDDDFGLRPLAR